jgi:hypothetical protein
VQLLNLYWLNGKVLSALASVAVAALLMVSSPADAQPPSPYTVETNVKGVYAYTQPPPSFDPMTASAAELQQYGYPPRPAADASPKDLAQWKMVVNPALTRVVPQLLPTNIYHRTVSGLVIKNAKAYSNNWSGRALVQKRPKFTSVSGSWTVPAIQQAGSCPAGGNYSSQWVGIDGFSNQELFQAGSDADLCPFNTTTTRYYPWIEWLPAAEIELTYGNGNPLPFAPGDYLIVNVTATGWSGGESSTGNLIYADITQGWEVITAVVASQLCDAYQFCGTYILGQSAEWIVEAPEVNGSIANLSNYVADPWFDASATDVRNRIYHPKTPRTARPYNITMVNGGGSPISIVNLFGTDVLWFFYGNSAP